VSKKKTPPKYQQETHGEKQCPIQIKMPSLNPTADKDAPVCKEKRLKYQQESHGEKQCPIRITTPSL
jgi:hypothetical protein